MPLGTETAASVDPMKTAVVGPHGRLYLTDGHHRFTTFWETSDGGPDMRLRVRIIGNLSTLEPAAFWPEMQRRGWAWLADANNQPMPADQLPDKLGLAGFGNDRYRGVLYFARDIGYIQEAANALFQEFYWARWLRANAFNPALNLDLYNLDDHASYLQLIRNIAEAQVALPDDAVISDGRTAADSGKCPPSTRPNTPQCHARTPMRIPGNSHTPWCTRQIVDAIEASVRTDRTGRRSSPCPTQR